MGSAIAKPMTATSLETSRRSLLASIGPYRKSSSDTGRAEQARGDWLPGLVPFKHTFLNIQRQRNCMNTREIGLRFHAEAEFELDNDSI